MLVWQSCAVLPWGSKRDASMPAILPSRSNFSAMERSVFSFSSIVYTLTAAVTCGRQCKQRHTVVLRLG